MPRAENRKRPPNSLGNVPGSGMRNKSYGGQNTPEQQGTQNKKKELAEKMKKIQQNLKVDSKNVEAKEADLKDQE